MKKAYRIFNEKTGEMILSFTASDDEQAIIQAKNFCKREQEAMRLERYRTIGTIIPWEQNKQKQPP